MKRLCVLAVFAALCISFAAAQDDDTSQTSGNLAERPQSAPTTPSLTQPAQAQPAPTKPDTDNVIKGSFPVQPEKTLDSSKLKEGDIVVCKTATAVRSRSGLMIPSGAKVMGHVTQAQARLKGDAESILAIEFDKIEYAKGEDMPMKGTLQAVAPGLGGPFLDTSAAPPQLSVSTSGRGSSNGSRPPATSSVQVAGPATGTPILHSDNQGVLGVRNLQMDADGVLTSPGKEVKLEAGMQFMIRVEIQMASR
jgi:hypothetical protein